MKLKMIGVAAAALACAAPTFAQGTAPPVMMHHDKMSHAQMMHEEMMTHHGKMTHAQMMYEEMMMHHSKKS